MSTLTVVSYANRETSGSRNLRQSLELHNYDYKFLGEGEKWEGFMTKINAYLRFVTNADPEELVVLVDAYDVLAVGGPDELLRKWNSRLDKRPILFSSEINSGINNCTPLNAYWGDVQRPTNSFLNSGFIMGQAKDLKIALQYAVDSHEKDDQYAMCKFADRHPDVVELDTENNIIGTMLYDVFKYGWNNDTRRITYGDKTPVFIHIPADHVDFGLRMIYFGSRLLGQQFEEVRTVERLRIFVAKWSYGTVVIILTLISVAIYFFPRVTMITLLMLVIIVFFARWIVTKRT